MRPILLAVLIIACSACNSNNPPRLECVVREQASAVMRPATETLRTYSIAAELTPSPDQPDMWDMRGTTEYRTGSETARVPTRGVYHRRKDGGFEMLAFGEFGTPHGKLNIAVQPDHPVLERRGTSAVVMTNADTVETGAPAQANCRIVEESR